MTQESSPIALVQSFRIEKSTHGLISNVDPTQQKIKDNKNFFFFKILSEFRIRSVFKDFTIISGYKTLLISMIWQIYKQF